MVVFLCGDVMTGRGIDQILSHPGAPQLFEPYVKNAGEYVALAEKAHGRVPRHASDAYVWGDALTELEHRQPSVRLGNLETSITRRGAPWPGKSIHYRMHPANAGCLTVARFDVCTLANNHVLDFAVDGLLDTLDVLAAQGIQTAGAGRDDGRAQAPAVLSLQPGSRVLVFAFGTTSSGIPVEWGASPHRAGIDLVTELSRGMATSIGDRIRRARRAQDVVVVSIHWGDNWGYDVPVAQQRFAHWLIDEGVDVVHGHSSHHPRPIEIYRHRLILYGCGDFLNDYEGITGYEQYRGDLVLMYFPTLDDTSGALTALAMVPMQIRHFRLVRPSTSDVRWLHQTLARESAPFGVDIVLDRDRVLTCIVPAA
jgi:poly-gamma-glutamate capsule biosynthesis protein CapA/YwtB (metallophosphatase superfamily)